MSRPETRFNRDHDEIDSLGHRIEQELHDGVGQYLTGIRLLSEHLVKRYEENGSKEDRRLVKAIHRYSRQAARQLQWIQGAIDSPDITRESLTEGLEEIASLVRDLPDTTCTLRIDESIPDIASAETRHHLLRIVQEAVHNAINHGHAGDIEIGVEVEDDRLVVSTQDSGIGFNPDSVHESGISNLKERAQTIGGTLSVTSTPSEGTHVRCEIDLAAITAPAR